MSTPSLEPVSKIPGLARFYVNWFVPRQPMWLQVGDLSRLGWRTDRWTPEYLLRRAGAQRVKVLRQRQPDAGYQPENIEYVDMVFGEFVQRVFTDPKGTDQLYLNLQTGRVLEPPLLQLMGDFSIPDFYCEVPIQSVNLWLGRSHHGITTMLHHDFSDNIYVVVWGRKRVTLYPPEQAPNLYPRGDLKRVKTNGFIEYRNMNVHGMPHVTQLDPEAPDLERFPGYEKAQAHRLDLEIAAGDVLYIPAGWFHQLQSLPGDHAAVSFFAEPPGEEGLRMMQAKVRDPAFLERVGMGARGGSG